MHHARRVALVALALTATACATAPPVAVRSTLGRVTAPDAAAAGRTAKLVDTLVPRLEVLCAALTARPVDVDVVIDVDGDVDVYGGYDARTHRIVIDAARGHPAATLAHELVHAMEPASWRQLPAVIREGLADHLAGRAVPEEAHGLRAARALSLAGYCGTGIFVERTPDAPPHVQVTERVRLDVAPLPPPIEVLAVPNGQVRSLGSGRELGALYALGLLIVERAGIAELTHLSTAAQDDGLDLVPPERLLAAAGLAPDPATWGPAIGAWVAGPGDRLALERRVRELEGARTR